MRLYHFPLSSNARCAVMTALHLAPLLPRPVELAEVDLSQGAQRAPGFLRLNPNGKVPVLVDGDFVLSESCAIMQYLAEIAPGQALWPAEPRARADVNRWMFWCANEFSPQVGILNFENWIKAMMGAGSPDAARVARAEADLRTHAAVLDTHLAKRTWISGEQLTLADLTLAAHLMSIGKARLPLTDLPHLMAWWTRVRELPVWQRTEPEL
ncbi:MAG: glutathione S-transferase family protein [Burkholderiaceae bacterium]|nr:glutathione S-transferase family protein [Burkholderiaceae bacterium]